MKPTEEATWEVTDLDRLRSTPLDEIRPADAKEIIWAVLKRGTVEAPVEVARFGSAI